MHNRVSTDIGGGATLSRDLFNFIGSLDSNELGNRNGWTICIYYKSFV